MCTDRCSSNFDCIETAGEYRCVCKRGYYYSAEQYTCLQLPGYQEDCTALCSSNLKCLDSPRFGKKCLCDLGFKYDVTNKECILEKSCSKKVDLLFLIDASDKVGANDFAKEIDFAVSIIQSFEVEQGHAHIAAATFASQAKKLFCFNTHNSKQNVINALKGARWVRGACMLDAGLRFAKTKAFVSECGVRSDSGKVVVIISSSKSTEPELTSEEARMLKGRGIQVIAVGAGLGVDKIELEQIASTKEQVFTVGNWGNARSIQSVAVTAVCEAAEISTRVPGYTEYCLNKCASNLQCVEMEEGVKICTCAPQQFFDDLTQRCVRTPDYNEACTSKCLHNLQCRPSQSGSVCLCPDGMFFDATQLTCVRNRDYQEQCDSAVVCATSLQCISGRCDCPQGMHWDVKAKRCAQIPGFGEVCVDICSNSLVCQDYGDGQLECGCPVGYYWAVDVSKCFKVPGYQEACTDFCMSPLLCLRGVCDCKVGFYYDTTELKCKQIPSHLEPCLGVCIGNLKCTSSGDKNTCICPSRFSFDKNKQECLLMQKCKAPVDLVFAIDASGSLGNTNFMKELQFAKEISQNFPLGQSDAQIGALTFSTDVDELFTLATHKDMSKVVDGLLKAPYTKGVTMTNLALSHARNNAFSVTAGQRAGAVKLLVVITDGKSTEPDNTVKEAMKLKTSGVTVVSVGVGSGIDEDELEVIASDLSLVFTAVSFDALDAIKAEVTALACEIAQADPNYNEVCKDKCASNYKCLEDNGVMKCLCPVGFYYDGTILACAKLPGYQESCIGRCSSQLVCGGGGVCICPGELEYDTGSQSCILREPCRAPLDLLFVVDSSGSLGTENFQKELAFVDRIINSFEVAPDKANVAMLTFSTGVKKQFCFHEHSTKAEVMQAVLSVAYARGVTMTHLALEAARNEFYTPTCGSRPHAAKVTVVITDGQSTYPSSTISAASFLHAGGVKVVSIGVGVAISLDELKIIASNDDLVFSADNFDVLDAIEKEVSATACEAAQSLPSYQEGCTDSCASNLLCQYHSTEYVCLCEDFYYWDPNTLSCVALKCLSGQNVCADKPNGDFPACAPECGVGFFYNCYNGHTELGQCVHGQLEIPLHPGQSSIDLPGLSSSERCSKMEALCPAH